MLMSKFKRAVTRQTAINGHMVCEVHREGDGLTGETATSWAEQLNFAVDAVEAMRMIIRDPWDHNACTEELERLLSRYDLGVMPDE